MLRERDSFSRKIKKVYIKKNVEITNEHHGITTLNKKGVLVIENMNGDIQVLNLESMSDITCDYIKVKDTKKTKIIYIFKFI